MITADQALWIVIFMVAFFVIVIAIGYVASKKTAIEREDYFMANRGFNSLVLLAAMTGTNLTSFIMLGVAGMAYQVGIGVYGLIGAIGFNAAVIFAYIGMKVWKAGKEHGFISPAQMFGYHYQSELVSLLFFIIMVVFTWPYITTGIMGAGMALEFYSNQVIPYWLGSLLITLVVMGYVFFGGMRGTAWTNVFQATVFIVFLMTVLISIFAKFGGVGKSFAMVGEAAPHLLQRVGFPPLTMTQWFSQFLLFSICVIAYPHILVRFMAAKSEQAVLVYPRYFPILNLLTFLPAVLLGVLGAALIPGLTGSATEQIIFILTSNFLAPWMLGFALAALLSFIMSSMDAQTLTISSMFTVDIVGKFWPSVDKIKQANIGKLFVVGILIISYGLAMLRPGTIFSLLIMASTGYAIITPVMLAAMLVPQVNKWAACSGLIAGLILTPIYFFTKLLPTFGFLPIVPIIIVEVVVMAIVTVLTKEKGEAGILFTAGK